MFSKICLIASLVLCVVIVVNAAINFTVVKFGPCDPKANYAFAISATFRPAKGGAQYVDGEGDFKMPYGQNNGVNITLSFRKDGGRYVKLFNIYDTNLCKAYRTYLGEFFYELEQAAGISAKECPIHKGRYHITNHELSFNRLSVQTFPTGYLKFEHRVFHSVSNKELGCLIMEVQNRK